MSGLGTSVPLRSAPATTVLAAGRRSCRARRRAALTLVFVGVLTAGAATGAWHGQPAVAASSLAAVRLSARPGAGTAELSSVEAAAEDAAARGQSAAAAAEETANRAGDRWATGYSARQFDDFQQRLDGGYTGVGLEVRRASDGEIEVARVRRDSPAEHAGVHAGDLLSGIDGRPMADRPVTEVVGLLRGRAPALGDTRRPENGPVNDGGRHARPPGDASSGPPGTRPGPGHHERRRKGAAGGRAPSPAAGQSAAPSPSDVPVRLDLVRGARHWRATVRRARLRTESVRVERPAPPHPGSTVIRVHTFVRGTGARVRRALRTAPEGRGVLLDLRGNSGGLVHEAVETAGVFLDGGVVASYDVRGRQRTLTAAPGGDTHTPLVVLVDGGTMSAAELLAGALRDRGRAVLVGGGTFGKGAVQMPSELPDGSVAELTVGHYRTPSGRTVEGGGITPDLLVGEKQRERAARRVLKGLGGG